MKNILLQPFLIGLFGLFFTTLAHAQLDNPVKEIGFQIDAIEGIGNVALHFKKEGKKQRYFRMRALWSSNLAQVPSSPDFYNTYYALIGAGFEKRVDFKERVQLFAGVEVNVFTDWSKEASQNMEQKSLQYGTGLGIPIGVVFKYSEKWNIILEVAPTLQYARVDFDETTGQRFEGTSSILFNQQGFYVGVAYRFSTS